MPYTAEHKAHTRDRIVSAARRLFNQGGFSQVTIEQIMTEAELTRGGFYHHFGSKEQLFTEVVANYITCNPLAVEARRGGPEFGNAHFVARRLIDLYLSDDVFDDVAQHCPLYALPSDARALGEASREAYTDLLRGMTQVFQLALKGREDGDSRAQAIIAMCVGGMVLSRTTHDVSLRTSLRASAHAQAVRMLEE
ncbi:TetR/AcrR family transcriptional regulator [Asticcacaulis solisilvae]|uniref:TetR/AcrR family transcriptional regulator n=1 Tax=Asticcacaulis solisilvae TaxID=1217274 RepID=UPI003FD8564A